MLADCQKIIREVSIASSLDEALAILVRQVKDSLPVDAFAIYLTGAEAGQYVLMASDRAALEPTGQVLSAAQAGLLGLVGERQELRCDALFLAQGKRRRRMDEEPTSRSHIPH